MYYTKFLSSPYHSPSFLSFPQTSGVSQRNCSCMTYFVVLLSVFAGTRLTKTSMQINFDAIFQNDTKEVENVILITF